jgi:hypothetical protein
MWILCARFDTNSLEGFAEFAGTRRRRLQPSASREAALLHRQWRLFFEASLYQVRASKDKWFKGSHTNINPAIARPDGVVRSKEVVWMRAFPLLSSTSAMRLETSFSASADRGRASLWLRILPQKRSLTISGEQRSEISFGPVFPKRRHENDRP